MNQLDDMWYPAFLPGSQRGSSLRAQILAMIASHGSRGQPTSNMRMPLVWVSRWRSVTPSLPPAANSGMNRATGSSRSSAPRSQNRASATAAVGLLEESQRVMVSGVIGAPRRASPIAASATTSPSRET